MNTNNSIIEEYVESINKLCNTYINGNYRDDFKQELFIILLEMPNAKISQLHKDNELLRYIVGVIKNQYNSKTSSFYRKYKLYDINRQDLDVVEDTNDD